MGLLADPVRSLEDRLGHRFVRRDLLQTALTHRSWANEQGVEDHYERLEFLGDSVLGLLTADWLFGSRWELSEGELSRLMSYLVSESVLASWAEQLGVGEALRLGIGEERSGGREKASLLADAMEAVLGVLFLDVGLDRTRELVRPLLENAIVERPAAGLGDDKTRLQELIQARGWELPEYRLVDQEGPDHRKRFTVECRVDGRRAGTGEGRTKKVAEQRAAAEALRALESGGGDRASSASRRKPER